MPPQRSEEWISGPAFPLLGIIIGKAYILLRLGGAEVAAVSPTGDSPILLAFKIGWLNEWKTSLDRRGMDPDALYEKED